jgi:hypothetical protein
MAHLKTGGFKWVVKHLKQMQVRSEMKWCDNDRGATLIL